MSNYVKIELTDTYDDLARKINMLDPVAKLERDAADPETMDASSTRLVKIAPG